MRHLIGSNGITSVLGNKDDPEAAEVGDDRRFPDRLGRQKFPGGLWGWGDGGGEGWGCVEFLLRSRGLCGRTWTFTWGLEDCWSAARDRRMWIMGCYVAATGSIHAF